MSNNFFFLPKHWTEGSRQNVSKTFYIISMRTGRKNKKEICIIDRYFVDISKIESTKRFQMLKRKNYFFLSPLRTQRKKKIHFVTLEVKTHTHNISTSVTLFHTFPHKTNFYLPKVSKVYYGKTLFVCFWVRLRLVL